MRISVSENYRHEYGCEMTPCDRHYCAEHWLLWRDCDTAQPDRDGAGQKWWELRDCPECERDAQLRRMRQIEADLEAIHGRSKNAA